MSTKTNASVERVGILMVEDSSTQAEKLRHLLDQNHYEVTVAKNGKEALALLVGFAPELVITDIVMPEMDGYELCHRIKEDVHTEDVPVILLTSLSNAEDVLEGLACGADSFITKPYNEDYLLTNLKQILANRRLRNGQRVRIGVEIMFGGKRRFITADQQQMLTLLISTYEAAVHRNTELIQTQEELSTLNVRLEDMVAERTAALVAEIAVRKQAEDELRESEERYRALVDSAPDAIIVYRGDEILYANAVAVRLTGLETLENLMAKSVLDVIHPDEQKQVAERMRLGMEGQYLPLRETKLLRPDGEVVFIETVGRPVNYKGENAVQVYVRDITERKRAEEELRFSNTLLRTQQEASIDGILVVDENGAILSANKRFAELMDVPLELLEKRDDGPVLRIAVSRMADPESFLQRVRYLYEHRQEVSREEIPLKDGRTFDRYSAPIFGDDGQYYGRVWYFRDITDRKIAESHIERLSRFPAENPNPVMRILANGVVEYANAPAASLLANMRAEAGSHIASAWQKHVDQALRTGQMLSREMSIGYRHFSVTLAPVVDQDYANVYANEITERKHAEDALRASEMKFRSIVDNIGIGVCLIGPGMQIIEMNSQMRAWFPNVHQNDHPICYHVFNTPPEESSCKGCPTWQTLHDGRVHEFVKQTSQDGKGYTYRLISSPICNDRGEVIAAIEMVEDVSERLSLENQLRQAQKMEAIGQLAGGVAHDFNNILQAIVGYSSMLLDRLPEQDDTREFAEEIAQGADRAAMLTRQLLAFSRRQVLEMDDLDLNKVIKGVAKMIRRIIGEDINVQIMEGRRLGTVHADCGQMEQVLLNLCVNARDAMPEGGTLTIETENVAMDNEYCAAHAWASPGRYVLLSVTDTGCGMDAQTQARIFEPFFTTKELGKGTGLGLATVYGIVRQHEGMIQVYSEVGKGTMFKIYLPIVEREASTVGVKVVERPRGGAETILVAEDDPTLQKLTALMLSHAGYTVLLANDGEEALDVFGAHAAEIALVLLDVVMPKKGGRAVYDALHQRYPRLRFLFSSGYSANAIHTGFVLKEGIELIQKPFAPDALLRKVREVLDKPDAGLIPESDPTQEGDAE